jgi:hypothetical protein
MVTVATSSSTVFLRACVAGGEAPLRGAVWVVAVDRSQDALGGGALDDG